MRTVSYPPRLATVLTVLVAVLLPVATGVGLFVPGFYHDTAWMIPQARGQDLVTLVVVEPLLIVGSIWAWRGRLAASLLWLGALGYVLYTYAMYSYTAYFNALFLVYVALFSASLFALIDLLTHLDLDRVRAAVRPTMPVRAIAAYLTLVGLFFLVAWLGQIVPAIQGGTVPQAVTMAKTPTSAVHVQDLAVVIPLLLVAALWLWQRRPRGVVLAGLLLVVADVMLVALLSMGIFMAQAHIAGALDMQWIFAALTIASLGFTTLFFAQLRRPEMAREAGPAPSMGTGAAPTPSAPDAGEVARAREPSAV